MLFLILYSDEESVMKNGRAKGKGLLEAMKDRGGTGYSRIS
jgi:hypothetical protein